MHSLNLITFGWMFFAAWTATVAGLTVKAFGPDFAQVFAKTKRPD